MSLKSERKKRIKEQKQAEEITLRSPVARKWYAEDAAEFVENHRKHCTDPTCAQAVAYSLRGQRMVAMVYPQKLNEIFFAVYGTGTASDYQPFMSLQLANPEDIRAMFKADGSLQSCQCGSGCRHGHDESMRFACLAFTCHNDGAAVTVEPNLPGVVTIRCKTCGKWLRGLGLAEQFQLAPRPKAKWPNIFCSHHGIEPGYVVCRHVLEEGKYPTWLWAPDAENVGEALCEACGKLREDGSLFKEENRALWVSTCQSGLNEHLHGRLKEMLGEVGQSFYVSPETVLNAPSSTAVN